MDNRPDQQPQQPRPHPHQEPRPTSMQPDRRRTHRSSHDKREACQQAPDREALAPLVGVMTNTAAQPDQDCDCGEPVFIIKTGECQRCYNKRYAREHASRYVPRPKVEREPQRTPCTYATAHHRVYSERGKATEHTCPCGQPAQQWALNNNSPRIQHGTRLRQRYDREYTVNSTWSPDPMDYDALCITCHAERDGRTDWGKGERRLTRLKYRTPEVEAIIATRRTAQADQARQRTSRLPNW